MTTLFLHGLGQNVDVWRPTIDLLPMREDAVSCPDLVRLMQTSGPAFEDLYRAFSEQCAKAEAPLHLCGLSLGAELALQYTLEHPERVRSLVLIAAQAKMPKTLLKMQNMVFFCMPKVSFAKMGLEKRALIQLTRSMCRLDFHEKLPRIQCPVLVLCGEKDKANKRAAKQIAQRLPLSQLHFVPQAGHEVNVDAPQALAERLQAFYQPDRPL